MGLQIFYDPIQLALPKKTGLTHQPLASAEPAVDRTLIGDHEQNPVRVAMDQMGDRAIKVLMQGIVGALVSQLLGFGNHLTPNRITLFLYQLHPHGGDAHGILAHHVFNRFRIDIQVFG